MDPISTDVKGGHFICSNQDIPETEPIHEPKARTLGGKCAETHLENTEAKPTRFEACCQMIQTPFKEYRYVLATPKLPFLMLSIFVGFTGYYNSFFILPPLAKELGLSNLETSRILVVTIVVEIVSKLVVGLIVDRCHIPKRTVLLPSYAITGAVGIIVSFVPNSYALYGYGVVLGAFGGSFIGIAIPMMIDMVGDEKKGTAVGMYPLFVGISNAIGPAILGMVAQFTGSYASCLLVCACAYLVGILCYCGTFCPSSTSNRLRRSTESTSHT